MSSNEHSKNEIFQQKIYLKSRIPILALTVIFGIVGGIAPMIYAFIYGFPVPHVHDEFGYLLASDTFANGRLSNPVPVFYENFEAPHILVKPSYASKYPPMQGMFLAFGQVLFKNPIFGVWFSCGLAAASLFWMLSVWTDKKWAISGTLLMICLIGINSYWAQSYWGGMVATAGGALFFGGFLKTLKKPSIFITIIMTLGGIILINSRPYEGTATMVPSIIFLLFKVLFSKKISLSKKILDIILPGLLLTSLSISLMAYYNYQITGSYFRFPYSEHQTQYFSTPLFIFQSPNLSPKEGNPRLRKLYDYTNCSQPIRDLDFYGLPKNPNLYPVYALVFLSINTPYFLLSLPLLILLFASFIFLKQTTKQYKFILLTVFFTFCCMAIVPYWDNVHYAAPLTCCFFYLLIEGIRQIICFTKNSFQKKLTFTIIGLFIAFAISYQFNEIPSFLLNKNNSMILMETSKMEFQLNKLTEIPFSEDITYLKPVIDRSAEKYKDSFLAFVSYNDNFTIQRDIVFNKADLDSSKIIYANDLGETENRRLMNYYNNRKVLFIYINDSKIQIVPLAAQN